MESGNGGYLQNIFKLVSARPRLVIAQKHEGTVEIEPEDIKRLVYIENCSKCQMILKKKPVKVVIEKCQDLVFTLGAGIVSGTLEVIKCSNLSINIEEEVKISTITADSTTGLQIILHKDENQLESLYSHQSSELSITLGTSEERKYFSVIPPAEDPGYLQFISHWESEDGCMKLTTEKVLREGILPCTEKKK